MGCCESRDQNDRNKFLNNNFVIPDDDQFLMRKTEGVKFYDVKELETKKEDDQECLAWAKTGTYSHYQDMQKQKKKNKKKEKKKLIAQFQHNRTGTNTAVEIPFSNYL